MRKTLFNVAMTAVCLWALASPEVCRAFCTPAAADTGHAGCHEVASDAVPPGDPEPAHDRDAPCCDRPLLMPATVLSTALDGEQVLLALPILQVTSLLRTSSSHWIDRPPGSLRRLNSPYLYTTPPRLVYAPTLPA